MKTRVILVEKSLGYLDSYICPTPIISFFLHKIHFNTLPLGDVVLGGNGNLYVKKLFNDQSFITVGIT